MLEDTILQLNTAVAGLTDVLERMLERAERLDADPEPAPEGAVPVPSTGQTQPEPTKRTRRTQAQIAADAAAAQSPTPAPSTSAVGAAPATAVPEKAPEPAAPAGEPAASGPSYADVRAAAVALSEVVPTAKMGEVLSRLGVARVPELAADQYGDAVELFNSERERAQAAALLG